MELVQSFLTRNKCYKAGRIITPSGVMLHSIGVNQPKASVLINSWDNEDYVFACVHAFIDANDGLVYQTLPWTIRGWHAGGKANNTHIGVEMCEPDGISYTKGSSRFKLVGDVDKASAQVERTYRSAVELFAFLCKMFDLDPTKDGVVISHKEGHKRGLASNHGDPEHLWSNKYIGGGHTMDKFREDVLDALLKRQNGSALPFQVYVTIRNLWIRPEPNFNWPSGLEPSFTGVGLFTIVEERNGFGRLKSGAGWINLNNPGVKRV